MQVAEKLPPITMLGGNFQHGSYILRIKLNAGANVRFGRFKKGKRITLPAGEYAYIGSAMSTKGATSLPLRLIRHATRSGDKLPHQIRTEMVERFRRSGVAAKSFLPRPGKKLYWNVDYLLDLPAAEIVNVFVLRSNQRLEAGIGRFLENDPHAHIIEKGLGANDVLGNTHILRIDADETWWCELMERLRMLL